MLRRCRSGHVADGELAGGWGGWANSGARLAESRLVGVVDVGAWRRVSREGCEGRRERRLPNRRRAAPPAALSSARARARVHVGCHESRAVPRSGDAAPSGTSTGIEPAEASIADTSRRD